MLDGEVDEGAFPSLAIGSTELLFEDLWREGRFIKEEKAMEIIETLLKDNLFFLKEIKKQVQLLSEIKPQSKKRGTIKGRDLYRN